MVGDITGQRMHIIRDSMARLTKEDRENIIRKLNAPPKKLPNGKMHKYNQADAHREYGVSKPAISKLVKVHERKVTEVTDKLTEVNGKLNERKRELVEVDTKIERAQMLSLLKDHIKECGGIKDVTTLVREINNTLNGIDGYVKNQVLFNMGDIHSTTNVQINIQNEINKIYPRLCDKCKKAVRE